MFVFAVAIAVAQDFGGSMGLVAANAEVDAYVAKFRGYVIVENANLVVV